MHAGGPRSGVEPGSLFLGRVREAGHLSWDEYLHELGLERQRVAAIVAERKGSGGGHYDNTKVIYVSKRFARALVASAMESRTSSTEAFRLLGLRKASTFDRLAERLGIV